MSLTNFIPQLWSARLLANLNKAHVFGNIVNRDFEGEIKNFGDTVKINKMGDITIGDYDGSDITPAEDLSSSQAILNIDQAKYFNFQVDSIDEHQSNINLMDAGMARASYGLADVVDQAIAGVYAQATSQIGDATAGEQITASNVYDTMVDVATALDEKNASRLNRFVVVAPWLHGLLLKSPEFQRSTQLGDQTVTNGFVGAVAGLNVFVSNNVALSGSVYKILAGSPEAITMAEQIIDVRAYQPEKRFADAVKGLHVYGVKVTNPDALACLNAIK